MLPLRTWTLYVATVTALIFLATITFALRTLVLSESPDAFLVAFDWAVGSLTLTAILVLSTLISDIRKNRGAET